MGIENVKKQTKTTKNTHYAIPNRAARFSFFACEEGGGGSGVNTQDEENQRAGGREPRLDSLLCTCHKFPQIAHRPILETATKFWSGRNERAVICSMMALFPDRADEDDRTSAKTFEPIPEEQVFIGLREGSTSEASILPSP